MPLREAFNSSLDKLVRPEVRVLHRPWSAFKVCGYMGLALAILLTMTLVTHLGLSLWVMAAIVLAAVLTFLGLAMTTKIITGEEKLVYYYHEIAVILVVAVLLWLLRQPILQYLDVTILGVSLFVAYGRVGCLMVGCCHGRPSHWGVCYREEHAAGFAPYFVGVRLFPIQVVESLWLFGIVLVGSLLVLSTHPPGTALAWYVVTYGIGRFCFEFMRGDPERSYFGGFSEAQWISPLLMCVVVGAELFGVLIFHPWHAAATAGLVFAMIAITLVRRVRRTAKHQLLHPHHVKEVAEAAEWVSNLAIDRTVSRQDSVPVDIHLGCTSLGFQISASKIQSAAGCIYHYALSHQTGTMTEEAARTLVTLILQLKRSSGPNKFIKRNQGVFHLLIYPRTGTELASQ